ncbi:hypothetical protein KKH26_01210 [Patescibacteria group bacterium]|nr:hypothetical protein [Patescibacteria group bacterium]
MSFLKEQEISFIQCQTEDEHDFMMGITLSMPELLTIVIDVLISRYSKQCDRKKPDMKKMMEWAVPASNSLFSVYARAVNSSANWLRKDLLLGAHGDLVGSARKTFGELSKISTDEIAKKLAKQKDFVKTLSSEERKRVNQWIEMWFVDSTQKIFSFHKKPK